MKTYLLILVLAFIIIASPVDAERPFHVRFAVISDCHIRANAVDNPNYFKLLYYGPDILRTAISEINALNLDDDPSNDIDFVLFGGDSCDGNQNEHYNLFMEILKDLKVPFYMVNGDWDYWNDFTPSFIGKSFNCPYSNLRELLLFEESACPGLRKRDYSIDITTSDGDIVHLVGMDNVLHFNGYRGSYEPQQIEWLEQDLNLNEGKPIIILQHCPVLMPDYVNHLDSEGNIESTSIMWLDYDLEDELSGLRKPNEYLKDTPWRKDKPADNSSEFYNLLKYYNVRAVFMSDLHLNKKIVIPYNIGNTLYSMNPALISYPCAYTIFEMSDDSIKWQVKRIEKYATMCEEYDRRSLEAFNTAMGKLSGDKYQYDIEKTLEISYGDEDDWSGVMTFM